ncbi:MAG: gfo/Idh/MocA family oxidoreductase [Planctomycetaceae bacterium]|nr:MAG: gfo/Idh/MocA family oxidoreductase [Planctomycetaceae bacterium]
MDRRKFLRESAVGFSVAAGSLSQGNVAKATANERIRVGCIGAGGRALRLVSTFSAHPDVEVVGIADIDNRKFPDALAVAQKNQGKRPAVMRDFRRLIDDPTIDAIVVGTPDHWHAIPTILACLAGKDVYVEKPDGHNIVEGQRMVAAMRKTGRVVQLGSQHRSTTRLQSAMSFVRDGGLGKCLLAKAWESTKQGSIGFPEDSTPPPEVDYDMWLGPAPERPFNIRRFHGTWRWFFDYGTGDLGNDGVHRLDMALALLNEAAVAQGDSPLGLPDSVAASGGKWYFDDLQEFPDTLQVNYNYGGPTPKFLTYEMRIWAPYNYHNEGEGAAVYGDQAYLVIGNNRWRAYGPKNELIKEVTGDSDETPHVQNFLDCMRSRQKPACDLETIGHPASVLCHAGNLSARLGRQLFLDPQTETFRDDAEANSLRTRTEYRRPWVLPEV